MFLLYESESKIDFYGSKYCNLRREDFSPSITFWNVSKNKFPTIYFFSILGFSVSSQYSKKDALCLYTKGEILFSKSLVWYNAGIPAIVSNFHGQKKEENSKQGREFQNNSELKISK